MSCPGLDRARVEWQAGRLWRAKEILRGNIGSQPFDPALCLAYGELLLELGDVPEAGKFLFLAGSELPQHADAVQVFLGRHAKSLGQLEAHLPRQARGLAPESYPPFVRRVLEQGGYRAPGGDGAARKARERRLLRRGQLVMVAVFFFAVVGFVQSVVWIGKLLVDIRPGLHFR